METETNKTEPDVIRKEINLKRIVWLDISRTFRPENKNQNEFRVYDEKLAQTDPILQRVFETYKQMHQYQTVDFNQQQIDLPNIIHAYQTAERIRERYPAEDWFHLTGLIHDLGKVLGVCGEPQWAVAGDTFVVGCSPAASIVFRDSTFTDNPDLQDPRYNTKNGIYQQGCGLDNLLISWGHDEYLYHVIKNHPKNGLPDEALGIIRYHSFYPWHTGGDYWHFANENDKNVVYHWVKAFNKFDLYSKSDHMPNIDELKPYYQSLVDKYLPGKLNF